MRKFLLAGAALALASTLMVSGGAYAAAAPARVEFETMTWPEVKAALAAGNRVLLAACWSHARRRFYDLAEAGSPIAASSVCAESSATGAALSSPDSCDAAAPHSRPRSSERAPSMIRSASPISACSPHPPSISSPSPYTSP